MKGLCILGSTGSIGVSTLDVVARHPSLYQIIALTARNNVELLAKQCVQFKPKYAVLIDPDKAEVLEQELNRLELTDTEILSGENALEEVAALDQVNTVMAAIVGAAGLLPTLAAANAGKDVLLANKEALVMSGEILIEAVKHSGATLLPIDSEHNAIFQCMPGDYRIGEAAPAVRRILLTASGGPFRETPIKELESVTPEQAVAHPNWDMGRKISVDSATMMNKGLELIEACLLFDLPSSQIEVVIHPQSVIHSMVDYVDGTVLAQLGNPDMRIPIAHALAMPNRFESGAEPLNIFDIQRLDFEPPDLNRFPCLRLAHEAINAGGLMPTVLNAANEIAVEAFLNSRLRYVDITKTIELTMQQFSATPASQLDIILETDQAAREISNQLVSDLKI